MMDIFKLFKDELKGKHIAKSTAPIVPDKSKQSGLIWQRFWGQYDGVMEFACMRQSVNISTEHYAKIDEMFIESLQELVVNTQALIDDYKKNQEAK